MLAEQAAVQEFIRRFGSAPAGLVRSPGRVNLIGEHTDYNQGFVMPLAIRQSLYLAFEPRMDRKIVAHSLDLGTTIEFNLDDFVNTASGWGEYVKGTAWALQAGGQVLSGWQGVLAGEIPIGTGLSSSAALELGVARVFQTVSGFEWDAVRMAQAGQLAENEWVGVNCGIMDQLIIAAGREGHALKIDCRSLELEPIPLPDSIQVVIIDSATRRGQTGLADSAYNERRRECEAAAVWFAVSSLRDVRFEDLKSEKQRLDPTIYERAHHVLTENRRVEQAVAAMKGADFAGLGAVLREGHASLRDDFAVSREEIDALVEIANGQPACYGARMTGGGFGGCVVSLVRSGTASEFVEAVKVSYMQRTGLRAEFYITTAMDGVRSGTVNHLPAGNVWIVGGRVI